jgi:hypothetical protein
MMRNLIKKIFSIIEVTEVEEDREVDLILLPPPPHALSVVPPVPEYVALVFKST